MFPLSLSLSAVKDNILHLIHFILVWFFNPVYSYFQLFYQNSVSAQK